MKIELIPNLIFLGMTEREAKLYVAMMEKPEWRSGELHRITGVPRPQTHQTLELMVSRQYCSKRSEGRFNYYRATPPDQLNEVLKHRWEKDIARKFNQADATLHELAETFVEATREDRSLDSVEIIRTPHRVHQRFMELILSAEEEASTFNKSPYSFTKGKDNWVAKRKQQENANLKMDDKGVLRRAVMMYEKDFWDDFKKVFHPQMTKLTENLPLKMTVIDRKITLMSYRGIKDDYNDEICHLVIHDRDIAEAHAEYFEIYWNKSYFYDEWIKKYPDKA